jgi:hypothetical protein
MVTMHCSRPFTTLHVLHGCCATCCPHWLDPSAVVFGSRDDPWGVWNSEPFRALRRQVLAGDFSLCHNCVLYQNGTPEGNGHAEDWHREIMETGPRIFLLGNDRRCNLHCWQCRPGPVTVGDDSAIRRQTEAFVSAFLPHIRLLSVSHAGDPFAAPTSFDLLRSVRAAGWTQLRVELFTNGLLLPLRWPDLVDLHPAIYRVNMSIDAATKETYEALRRGGRWEDLLAALQFVASLRDQGVLAEFQANFAIQAANVQEIPAFVRLAKDHRATCVKFALLGRTWHSEADYAAANVAWPRHRLHGTLREVLASPEFANPVVDASFASEMQIHDHGAQ